MLREEKELGAFVDRIIASGGFLWQAACAITADRVMAEAALNEALVAAYVKGGKLSFRDGVLSALKKSAFRLLAAEDSDGAWDGLIVGEDGDRIAVLIAQEPIEVQRMCVLRYGCGLSIEEIASVMSAAEESVTQAIDKSRLRIERILNNEKRPTRPFDRLAAKAVRRAMNRSGAGQFDVNRVVEGFTREVMARARPRRIIRRILSGATLAALGIIFAALLWLLAILLEM